MIGLEYICMIRGIPFSDFSAQCGVSKQTFQDWVKNRRKIPIVRLTLISNRMNIDSYLIQKEINVSDKVKILRYEIERLVCLDEENF